MHAAEIKALKNAAKRILEEEMEESSVTDARDGLLPTIERMQKDPSIRVLIRKHGAARAVLMSAPTYEAFMKLVKLFVEKTDAMSREERIEAAFQRLQSERPSDAEQAMAAVATGSRTVRTLTLHKKDEAKVLIGVIAEKLRELGTTLDE